MCFGPEFSQFFEKTERINGEDVSKKLNEFNFNIHYVFEINESLGFYPLTGLITVRKRKNLVTAIESVLLRTMPMELIWVLAFIN